MKLVKTRHQQLQEWWDGLSLSDRLAATTDQWLMEQFNFTKEEANHVGVLCNYSYGEALDKAIEAVLKRRKFRNDFKALLSEDS